MINIELSNRLTKNFHLEQMTDKQKESFLVRVGNIIIESSISRLLLELSESEIEKIEEYLDNEKEADIFVYLTENFQKFGDILEEEIVGFQEDSDDVIGG